MLGSEAILYLVTFGARLFSFPSSGTRASWLACSGTAQRPSDFASVSLITAFVCFALALVNGFLIPGPENAPIDKIFAPPARPGFSSASASPSRLSLKRYLPRLSAARPLHRLRLGRRNATHEPAAPARRERPAAMVARRHGDLPPSSPAFPSPSCTPSRPATPGPVLSAGRCEPGPLRCASRLAPWPPASWSTPATTSCSSPSC